MRENQFIEKLKGQQQLGYFVRILVCLTLICIPVSIGLTALVAFYQLPFWTIIAVGTPLALTLSYFIIAALVPDKLKQEAQLAAILEAINDPSTIVSSATKQVRLNHQGKTLVLDRVHRKLWTQQVVPYAYKNHAVQMRSEKNRLQNNLSLNARKRLNVQQDSINDLLRQLSRAREELEIKQNELDNQSLKLHEAEDMVIERLDQIEVAETEIAQLREDVTYAERSQGTQEYSASAAELAEKEGLLESLRSELLNDKKIVERQKTELNQLKGELLAQAQSANEIPSQFEASEVSAVAEDIESNEAYLQQIEEELMDRLQALSEREAAVEQREINAGLRSEA